MADRYDLARQVAGERDEEKVPDQQQEVQSIVEIWSKPSWSTRKDAEDWCIEKGLIRPA